MRGRHLDLHSGGGGGGRTLGFLTSGLIKKSTWSPDWRTTPRATSRLWKNKFGYGAVEQTINP